MANKIQVRLILEILGRPPEHIIQGLQMLIDKMKAEKGIKVIHFNIHEPTPVKDSKDLFTSFADLEIELDSMANLFLIAYNYMPANIEVIYPENVELSNNDLNYAIGQLVQRLHNYDAVTKKILNERDFLVHKLQEVAPHLFKQPEPVQPAISEVKQDENVKKKAKSSKKVSKKGKKK